jgi:hypothetical protein
MIVKHENYLSIVKPKKVVGRNSLVWSNNGPCSTGIKVSVGDHLSRSLLSTQTGASSSSWPRRSRYSPSTSRTYCIPEVKAERERSIGGQFLLGAKCSEFQPARGSISSFRLSEPSCLTNHAYRHSHDKHRILHLLRARELRLLF